MIGFLIALLSGALMSVQGVFNTQVTKTAGMWVSNGWVQLSAFTVCAVLWLFTGRDSIAAIGKVEPKYMLLGGVIGAGITWTVIKSMAQLGPAKAAIFYCYVSADRCISDRGDGTVRCGEGAAGVAAGHRYGDRADRSCNFSVEIVQ